MIILKGYRWQSVYREHYALFNVGRLRYDFMLFQAY